MSCFYKYVTEISATMFTHTILSILWSTPHRHIFKMHSCADNLVHTQVIIQSTLTNTHKQP